MKDSTKQFLGAVLKGATCVGLMALCKKTGVPWTVSIGNTDNRSDGGYTVREPIGTATRWPEAVTPLEKQMLAIAQSGRHCDYDSGKLNAARRIFKLAEENATTDEKGYAADLLRILSRFVDYDNTRNTIINGIADL